MSATIFSGNSRFAADFQAVIDRSVSIASLPMGQMQNVRNGLSAQSSEMNALSAKFSGLQSTIDSLAAALGAGSFQSTLSDNAVASTALSGSPMAGAYNLQVIDIGANASAMSAAGVTDATLGDATCLTLQVGAIQHTIKPSSNTLAALADAINLAGGSNVQATLVNVAPPSADPQYRLSLQGTKLGDLPIQLTLNGGSNEGQTLLEPRAVGAAATYRINGEPSDPISSDTRTVTLAPGLSATMLAEGKTEVTVSRTTVAVSSALANFVSAYNLTQAEIDTNRGAGKGALKGQSVVASLSDALHSITQYSTGDSGISSLTALGLSFDKSGVLSFDSSTFQAATGGQMAQLAKFLGAKDGGGFLAAAGGILNGLEDEQDGLFHDGIDLLGKEVSQQDQAIADQQARVDRMKENLQAQMAQSDAMIAQLEQQVTYFANMFASMQTNSQSMQ